MYFNYFFNLPMEALPRDTEYYFNVLIFICCVKAETFINNLTRVEDISRVKEPRPICVLWCVDDEVPENTVTVEYFDHAVVEVNTKTNEVCWYDMLDFDCERLFAIEPILEDFNEEDEYEEN